MKNILTFLAAMLLIPVVSFAQAAGEVSEPFTIAGIRLEFIFFCPNPVGRGSFP
ncbi:hypothetical protein QQ054_04100 [Oscillatoria amoena NRMC-F 0135]|nr:hypothetical protein [Oscillatoria amoena NRMC-F 0135]